MENALFEPIFTPPCVSLPSTWHGTADTSPAVTQPVAHVTTQRAIMHCRVGGLAVNPLPARFLVRGCGIRGKGVPTAVVRVARTGQGQQATSQAHVGQEPIRRTVPL